MGDLGDSSVAARWLPHRWKLWSLPRPAIAYVLGVELVALGALLGAARHLPSSGQWRTAAWLAAITLVHLHVSHAVERRRRDHSKAMYVDLCSVWIFAGALVLPLFLELLLVALMYTHRWFLVNRFDAHRPPHRTVFTASMLALSAAAAVLVVHVTAVSGDLAAISNGAHPGVVDALALVAAIAAQWTVNTVLVAIIILLTAQVPVREAIGSAADNLLEISQLALGTFVALALFWSPPVALLMVVPTVALHKSVLVDQLKLAARTDSRTGLLNAVAWQEIATAALSRVRAERGRLAILMIDLDWFKKINDTHGHLVGDKVLITVAKVLGKSARRGDSVGRYGGEEFAILLPGATEDDARAFAERIRARIAALQLTDRSGNPVTLSATIGGAVYPDIPEHSLEGLLHAADAALYRGKHAGRNRVSLAAP